MERSALLILLFLFIARLNKGEDLEEDAQHVFSDEGSLDRELQMDYSFAFDHRRGYSDRRYRRGAASDSVSCVFPFLFNGKYHQTCIMEGEVTFYWCSLTSDYGVDLRWSPCEKAEGSPYTDCSSTSLYDDGRFENCYINLTDTRSALFVAYYCSESPVSDTYSTYECKGPYITQSSTQSTTAGNPTLQTTAQDTLGTITTLQTVPGTTLIQNTETSQNPTSQTTLVNTTTQNILTTLATTTPTIQTTLQTTTPTIQTTLQTTTPTIQTTLQTTTPNLLTTLDTTTATIQTTLHTLTPTIQTTTPSIQTTLHSTAPDLLTTLDTTTANLLTTLDTTTPNILTTLDTTTANLLTTLDTTTANILTTLDTTTENLLTTIDPTTPDILATLDSTTPEILTTINTTPDILTTLDTTPPTTLSTLSTTTTSSTLSSTTASTTTTTKTVPSTAGLTQIDSWLQRASANIGESEAVAIIDSVKTYTSSIGAAGYQLSDWLSITYLLGNLTEAAVQSNFRFSVDTVKKVGYIANQLFSNMSSDPSASIKNSLGPKLLGQMENIFAEMKVTNESFNISYGVVNFHCAVASCKDVENGIFMVLDSNSNVSLPDYDGEEDSSGDCYVNAVSMSYQPKNGSFNSQYGSQDTSMQGYYLVGEIMTKVLIVGDRNYHDANINLTFKCTEAPCDEKSQCVFWDFLSNMWSTEGCITQVTNGITKCDCNHLTSFAVLMSNSDEPDDPQNTQALDIITRVGLAISILSLIICIVFQLILLSSSGNLTASYRHISTLNISAFLLISNISFLASSFLDPITQNDICVAFTFCTHFSTLAFFCWTMVQGLFLVCRLVFVFHHVTKREFVGLSVVLGYLCPIIIATATYLVYSPTKNYRKHDACWLNISSGATLVFTIPVIIIMSVNVLVLIVVIRKLLRPSISEGGGEDEEAVKKMVKAIVFCTPQFGLTWAIGIPLLTNGNSLVLKYMFVLLNPIQGFFILLFTCLLDKKATDLIKKRFRKTSPANSTVTTMSTY